MPITKNGLELEDIEDFQRRKYSRSIFLLIGFFIGFIGYFPLFISVRLLFFIVPVVILCWALTGTEKRFNVILFVLILLGILIFSSTFMTSFMSLNATDPPEIDYPAFSMESFNYSLTMDSMDSFFTPIFTFLLIGLPAIALAGAIWAIIAGQLSEAISTILKLFLLFVLFMIIILAFDSIGYEVVGLTNGVKTAVEFYISAVNSIYEWILCLMGQCPDNSGGENVNVDAWGNPVSTPYGLGSKKPPGSKAQEDIQGDLDNNGSIDWFESLAWYFTSSQNHGYLDSLQANSYALQVGIASCFPLLISATCLLFSIIFLSGKARTWNDEFFDQVLPEEEPQEIHLLNFNYKMGAFGILILFGAWMMFLNFVGLYNETGVLNFTQIGYISIYSILIIFSIILLSFPRICIYTKSNWKNTLKGGVIGFGLLFLSFQFISGSQKTLSATGQEYPNPAILQLLNTFIFIAPAESFFFHILIPAFALGWMRSRSEKSLSKNSLFIIEHEIEKINGQVEVLLLLQPTLEQESERLKLAKIISTLKNKEAELKVNIILEKDFVFQDLNTYLLFYVVMILSNVAFSVSHWVLSGVDFYIFWLSGLGIIYLIAGCFITFIGWRYGWFSAILTHALYNAASIVMLIIFTGGI